MVSKKYRYVKMLPYILTLVIITFFMLYLFGKYPFTPENENHSFPTAMVTAGTLESVTVSEGLFSETSTIGLADGTHIRVKGAVNFWKAGTAVLNPSSESTDGTIQSTDIRQWCISGTCYQKR
ncbi:hypothetical protein [Pantoea ananatis]|uniref:hypothetical protein n=1 Tax=Pantoea ananas TaxID=553 RepID=UPI0021E75086|nr:hypothetical protein [Pantoea ananatis]MCW0309937.1 hypothetical protein [Pantoea ananatis]MCW0341649.1 hypothetical protein [Pantoea ananatis]MCW0360081.1 hypothetical protein [Pantoea ananatis]MCW0364744.1 hypothetical protein [Pantoea ananatis]MCW1777395.1 hypothetical protein [Pantoea ananatis]